MSTGALFEAEDLTDDDLSDALEGDELTSEYDELSEEDVEALDDLEDFVGEVDALGEDALGDELEGEDVDALGDEFGDYALDTATGLYLPDRSPTLVTGPAAVALARTLNAFAVDALDADDADAFFRRIRRIARRVGRVAGGAVRGIGRVARTVGRVAGPLLRRAMPLLQRALPIIQRVAGLAGPWGRLVSAGIGAARGLAEGRGLRGALAGAIGGAIPGIGGRLASSLLGADAADDDAALDALADMADARQVPAVVALPLGAGLAARVATPRPAGRMSPALQRQAARVEGVMVRAARAAGGSAGRQLRILRAIARLARRLLRRGGSIRVTIRALPVAATTAARRVVASAAARPSLGASTPAAASRRVAERRRILSRTPALRLFQPAPTGAGAF
jgi:hypothetical protein